LSSRVVIICARRRALRPFPFDPHLARVPHRKHLGTSTHLAIFRCWTGPYKEAQGATASGRLVPGLTA
jgi:hypothetical protein